MQKEMMAVNNNDGKYQPLLCLLPFGEDLGPSRPSNYLVGVLWDFAMWGKNTPKTL